MLRAVASTELLLEELDVGADDFRGERLQMLFFASGDVAAVSRAKMLDVYGARGRDVYDPPGHVAADILGRQSEALSAQPVLCELDVSGAHIDGGLEHVAAAEQLYFQAFATGTQLEQAVDQAFHCK